MYSLCIKISKYSGELCVSLRYHDAIIRKTGFGIDQHGTFGTNVCQN